MKGVAICTHALAAPSAALHATVGATNHCLMDECERAREEDPVLAEECSS
jgi:hypothetical protein